jgi:prepilin peptidase CpaA
MIDWIQVAPFFLAVAILIPAVVVDVRERRIPNTFCLAGFMTSIIVHGFLDGWGGLAMSAGTGLFLLIMMFPFFALNWMGAGDVKLIGTAGAIAGTLTAALTALLGIVIAGALMALLTTVRLKKLKHLTQRMALLSDTRNMSITKIEHAVSPTHMPYGIAIACGTIVVMAMRLFSAI